MENFENSFENVNYTAEVKTLERRLDELAAQEGKESFDTSDTEAVVGEVALLFGEGYTEAEVGAIVSAFFEKEQRDADLVDNLS